MFLRQTLVIFICVSMCLTACNSVKTGVYYHSQTPDPGRDGFALEEASNQFFGIRKSDNNSNNSNSNTAEAPDPETTGGGQSRNSVERVEIGFTSQALAQTPTQPVESSFSNAQTIGAYAQFSLSPSSVLRFSGGYSSGDSSYFLPEGFGVLADPTRIEFQKEAIDVALSIHQTLYTSNRFQFVADAGLGVEEAKIRSSIQSALLDIRTTTRIRSPFGTFGVSARPTSVAKNIPLVARIGVKVRDDGTPLLNAHAGIEF